MKFPTAIQSTVAVWTVALLGASAIGGIRVANQTSNAIGVSIKGVKDLEYRPDVIIQAKSELEILVPAGKYKVRTRLPKDQWHFMGWQNYSNHKITYKVSLCARCGPATGSDPNWEPRQAADPITEAEISRSESYWCSKCRKYHTSWKPGWGKRKVGARACITDASRVSQEFDSIGAYRLGISAVKAEYGVMVSDVADRSPARELQRIDRADDVYYHLTPGSNIITHLNGKRVRNTNEFSAALVAAQPRISLTVANTERGSVRLLDDASISR